MACAGRACVSRRCRLLGGCHAVPGVRVHLNVQVVGRLVQDEQVSLRHQRRGDGHPAALAPRHGAQRLPCTARGARSGGCCVDAVELMPGTQVDAQPAGPCKQEGRCQMAGQGRARVDDAQLLQGLPGLVICIPGAARLQVIRCCSQLLRLVDALHRTLPLAPATPVHSAQLCRPGSAAAAAHAAPQCVLPPIRLSRVCVPAQERDRRPECGPEQTHSCRARAWLASRSAAALSLSSSTVSRADLEGSRTGSWARKLHRRFLRRWIWPPSGTSSPALALSAQRRRERRRERMQGGACLSADAAATSCRRRWSRRRPACPRCAGRTPPPACMHCGCSPVWGGTEARQPCTAGGRAAPGTGSCRHRGCATRPRAQAGRSWALWRSCRASGPCQAPPRAWQLALRHSSAVSLPHTAAGCHTRACGHLPSAWLPASCPLRPDSSGSAGAGRRAGPDPG